MPNDIPVSEKRKTELIEEIEIVFDGVSREDGVTLHEAWVIDDYGSPEERAEARAEDTETRWQDVPEEDIRFGYIVLNFVDPKGWRYYIPAYLTWHLKYMDRDDLDWDSNTFDSIVYNLTAYTAGELKEHCLSKFSVLNKEQSRAVARVLVYLAVREDLYNAWDHMIRQGMITSGQWTVDDCISAQERSMIFSIQRDVPKNGARRALERYWAQFLPKDPAGGAGQ